MRHNTFNKTLVAGSLLAVSANLLAATDVAYHIAGQQQTIFCKTDGRNLWCPATRGLVLADDAVVDGDWYFLRGMPDAIDGTINGRAVTFIKGKMPSASPEADPEEEAVAKPKTRVIKVKDRKGHWVKKRVTVKEEEAPARHPDDIDGEPKLSIAERMLKAKGEEALALKDGPGNWRLSMGEKVSDAITRWANASGYQVVYEGPDVTSKVDVKLAGAFEGAIGELIEALNRSGTPMRAEFYEKNRVLRVTGNGGF
ncbi:MAG: toxin co-regulated pilus biosynthesis Q family protein [Oxalobacter sp.]|nr:toxin co-regulated pilus biosynthesis Q family protein [Oxalobacter sp.]